MNKFKIGDVVTYIGNEHENVRSSMGEVNEIRIKTTGTWLTAKIGGWLYYAPSHDFRLEPQKEQTMSENKNELRIGARLLRKDRLGSVLLVEHDRETELFLSDRKNVIDFLSTPYQEEEVYMRAGDRVAKGISEYVVTDLGEGSMGLVDVRSGILMYKRLVFEWKKTTLKDLLGRNEDISEWLILPREGEK